MRTHSHCLSFGHKSSSDREDIFMAGKDPASIGAMLASRGTPTKKRKRDESLITFADQKIATVFIEYGNLTPRQFNIHESLLCDHSESFREFFNPGNEAKVMILNDVRPSEFDTFSKWLYTKELFMEELEGEQEARAKSVGSAAIHEEEDHRHSQVDGQDSHDGYCNDNATSTHGTQRECNLSSSRANGEMISTNDKHWYQGRNRRSRVFAGLLDLYIFANKYKAAKFKTFIMLEFQRFLCGGPQPNASIVQRAFDNLDHQSSGMCRYLVQCNGHATPCKINVDLLARMSPQFLARTLSLTWQRLAGLPIDGSDDNWCDYHEHESEEDRRECEKGRPEDADMKKRRENLSKG